MDVGVEAGDVCGEDGDGLRDRDELSRLRLGGCLCHLRGSIVAIRWTSEAESSKVCAVLDPFGFGLG